MQVGRYAFVLTYLFHTDTASMAGGAVFGHVGNGKESMPLNQPAANRLGTADMAVAAACMAFPAVSVIVFLDCRIGIVGKSGAQTEHFFFTVQCRV